MKILLPYYSRSGILIDDKVTIGGLEKFAQLVYQNIDGVIPVHFTEDDRKNRKVTSKIVKAALENDVDIIISNYENATVSLNVQESLNIPIMWISHSCYGGIGRLIQAESMLKFIENGGPVYMMSENQYIGMDRLTKRIAGKPLNITGYINSAFCSGTESISADIEYDAITIGRMNREKNPFWLHKKLAGTNKHSLVLTSYVKEFMNSDQEAYYSENRNWEFPQETIYGLSHDKVHDKLSKSGCYISTHPRESWGITALEALSHGLPTMLITDSTGIHSSECIPASKDHILNIKSGIKPSDLAILVDKFGKMSYNKRIEISSMTKEKHSLSRWKKSIDDAIDRTISTYIKKKPERSILDFQEED